MVATNNVTRMLDAQEITYTAFEIPAEKLTALEVCDHLHIPPEEVFKAIVPSPRKKVRKLDPRSRSCHREG